MTNPAAIIEMGVWLQTPPGRYLATWEQRHFDHAVADIFGFHALQLGLPEIDTLRANRMPSRWLAHEDVLIPAAVEVPSDDEQLLIRPLNRHIALNCLPEALPFADQSLDLVVMPHTLEQCGEPHQALAEAVRVLRPEGRVVLSGFNPFSLWGLRQGMGGCCQHLWEGQRACFLPPCEELIAARRVRDWLRLLSCDIEAEHIGCHAPPFHSQRWLERWVWLDTLGPRWWPPLGAAYLLVAVKRVRGMRLVGLARSNRREARGTAVAASRNSI